MMYVVRFQLTYTSLISVQDDTKDEKVKEMARSRSAFFIDTAEAWDIMSARRQVKMTLDKIAPEIIKAGVKGLATFDRDLRIAAIADYNITRLLDAGNALHETEKARAKASEASRAKDASGLQLLASTLEQIHRGQGLVEPTRKSITNAIKKSNQVSKDTSSSNYYAQRVLPQTRPEKPRRGDSSPDGVLQVQPVTPKARTQRTNETTHGSNSKAKAAPSNGPVWHHFHVSSPVRAKGKASAAPSPKTISQQKSEDSKQRPLPAATQPIFGPAFEGSVNRSALKDRDQISFPQAQKPPALESASRARAESSRKIHGPVPEHMLGSVGSFNRFSIEPSKRPSNPRPLAAKPSSGPEKMAISAMSNEAQTHNTASILNPAPDGDQKEHQESQMATARRLPAEQPALPPILHPEVAAEQHPSISPTRISRGEYIAEVNRSNTESRRQSFGTLPSAQSLQAESGAYSQIPTNQQHRQDHHRQQAFESAPYLEEREATGHIWRVQWSFTKHEHSTRTVLELQPG
jgi:hypothetical protein